jgi:hypothetical protein
MSNPDHLKRGAAYGWPIPAILFGFGWNASWVLVIPSFLASVVWLVLFIYCLVRFRFATVWWLLPCSIIALWPFLALAILAVSFHFGQSP